MKALQAKKNKVPLLKQFLHKAAEHVFGEDKDQVLNTNAYARWKSLLNNSLVSFLPYECFDPETSIFHMQEAKGILLLAQPMNGASEENAHALYRMLQTSLPEGVIVHFQLYASPRIGPALDLFSKSREAASPIHQRTAQGRVDFLKQGIYQSLLPHSDFVLRDFQLSIGLIFDHSLDISDRSIQGHIAQLIGMLSSMGVFAQVAGATDFLQLADELLHPSLEIYPSKKKWDPLQSLAGQLADCQSSHKIDSQRIFYGEDKPFEIRSYSVADYPSHSGHLAEVGSLIGSLFDESQNIGCPFIFSFIVEIMEQRQEQGLALAKNVRARQRADKLGWLSRKLAKDGETWRGIIEQIESKERIVKTAYQIVLFTNPQDAERHESSLKAVFESQYWRLQKNSLVHMPVYLAVMPLFQSKALMQDLERLGQTQKMWAKNAAHIAPVLADPKGMGFGSLLLVSRRGQLFYFDPYGGRSTNNNICIDGGSGSGKSVVTQELAVWQIATGGRVFIIDVGRSYQNIADLMGGEFIEFNNHTSLNLNPFSAVGEGELDEIFMLALVSQMADPNCRLDGWESAVISKAIRHVWSSLGKQAGIGDVAEWLLQQEDKRAQDLGFMLYPYTVDGPYGRYFNGPATVDFNSRLVVFELEELKSNKSLQSIILSLLMYHVTEKMYLGNRRTRMTLIIDEAWDLLKGGQGGDIIESIVRRARKYGGNLITVTQSIMDYFASPAGTAAYNNSYWHLILPQLDTSISDAIKQEKINLDPFGEKLLRSIKTVPGQYSEILIKGGSGELVVGRFYLDPYSRILYSTKAEEYAAVKELREQGFSIDEAVSEVAKRVYG